MVATLIYSRSAGAGEPAAIEQDLFQLRDWAKRELPLITGQKTVLTEWHQEVSEASDQLYPELIRYADVIAAMSEAEGGNPAYPGFSAVEPKMVPGFSIMTDAGLSYRTGKYLMFNALTIP